MAPFLSPLSFTVRHGDKCIHARAHTQTQRHGNAEPVPESIPLSHQRRDLFACANVGGSSVLFSCFEFRADLSYSESLLKDPKSGLLGPRGNVNLRHNSLVSILPGDDFTFHTLWPERCRLRNHIFVCALSSMSGCAEVHVQGVKSYTCGLL